MSEVFEGYERQYCELSTNLSRKCNAAGSLLDGEQKSKEVVELQSGLDDADVLVTNSSLSLFSAKLPVVLVHNFAYRKLCQIRKMDLEARSLQPSVKAMLLAKLCEYKSDLTKLKREVKKLASAKSNQTAHEELLESGMANAHMASADERDRLAVSTDRLNQSSERIRDSRRAVFETEELGVSILQDLHQQRETLLNSHAKLHGVDDAIDKSKKVLTAVSRGGARNFVEGDPHH